MRSGHDEDDISRPVPDPTTLTLDAIARAARAEREHAESQRQVLRERLNGIDRATELLDRSVNLFPTDVEKAVGALKELTFEKVSGADIRYQQRFEAQERAVTIALQAVDKEFHEHLTQVRSETKAALDASEKAIEKAEIATQKAIEKAESATDTRFAAVNEFRAQLADQTATFMLRREAEQRIGQVDDKLGTFQTSFIQQINGMSQRIDGQIAAINSRLDRTEGSSKGKDASWGYLIAAIGLLSTIIAIVIAVGSIT